MCDRADRVSSKSLFVRVLESFLLVRQRELVLARVCGVCAKEERTYTQIGAPKRERQEQHREKAGRGDNVRCDGWMACAV